VFLNPGISGRELVSKQMEFTTNAFIALSKKKEAYEKFIKEWRTSRGPSTNLANAEINLGTKNPSFLNRIIGSVLPFYGGKSRKQKRRVKRATRHKKKSK